MKVAQNQSDYQLAASLYQKSLAMLKTAVGAARRSRRSWISSRRIVGRGLGPARPSPAACGSSPRTSPTPIRPPRSPAPIPTGARSRPSSAASTASSRRSVVELGRVSRDQSAFRTQVRARPSGRRRQGRGQAAQRQPADRDDGHARGPAQLRGQPQPHHRDAPDDRAHPRHPARLSVGAADHGHYTAFAAGAYAATQGLGAAS